MRRIPLLLSLLLLFAYALPAAPARAVDKNRVCFEQVPDCIEFRFRTFWRDNGGLQVFGLPLTPEHREKVGDEKYDVQYFERFRFEQHKENPAPYDVLLGRMGVDALAAQGRDWQSFPKASPNTAHYFAETGHAIAPQFWGFWSRNGLEFDGNKRAKSLAESLGLFGFPISEAQMEQGSDGQMYLTQWFERARFEYHPENRAPYNVLLGRLGADMLAAAPQASGAGPNPGQAVGCPQNAPAPAEGAQAWMFDPQPKAPGTNNAVCVLLIAGGAPVQGARATATAHYSDATFSYGPATTGPDGFAQIDFNIDKAKNRFVVKIDVTFEAPDGQSYTAATNFRPRYSFEEPPPPAGPVLTNIPAPAGNCVANAPAPVEGAQAWVTNIQPTEYAQFNSICARLIVNGAVVGGARAEAIAYLAGPNATYGPEMTGPDGVAEIGFNVGNARNRYIVYIDVSFHAPDGTAYGATTYFRPNYTNP